MSSKKKKSKDNYISVYPMKSKNSQHCYSEEDLAQLSLNVHLLQIRLQLHSLTYNGTSDNQTEKNTCSTTVIPRCCDPFKTHLKKHEKVKRVSSNNLRRISLNDYRVFSEQGLVVLPGYRVCINCSDKLNDLSKSVGKDG